MVFGFVILSCICFLVMEIRRKMRGVVGEWAAAVGGDSMWFFLGFGLV